MSDIPPIAGPPSPREDPVELHRFNWFMGIPLKFLALMKGEGTCPRLTEPHRFELAKLCAVSDASDTAKKIKLFMLNKAEQFEVVKLCVQEGAYPSNMNTFDFDVKQRFEIARLCAQKGMYPENIDMSDFEVEQRFEIARLCAQKGMYSLYILVKNIRSFDLGALRSFEIVKLCVQAGSYPVDRDINMLHFDAQHRFEIIQLYAQTGKYPSGINMADFEVLQRFEIAKLFASGGGYLDTIEMSDFDPLQRFEIARLCVQKDAYLPSGFNLVDFDILQRFEIARLLALDGRYSHSSKLLRSIDDFALPENQLIEILTIVVRNDPSLLKFMLYDAMKADPRVITCCTIILANMGWIEGREWEVISKKTNSEMQEKLLGQASETLKLWSLHATPEEMDWLLRQKCLFLILASRIPYLHSSLSKLAWQVARHPLHFEKLLDHFPPLLALPLAKMKAEGVDIDTLQGINAKHFEDAKKFIPFLNSMIQLAENELLSPEEKTRIIEDMTKGTTDIRERVVLLDGVQKHSAKGEKFEDLMKTLTERYPEYQGYTRQQIRKELKSVKEKVHVEENKTLNSARDLAIILDADHHLLQKADIKNANDLKVLASRAFQSLLPLPGPVDDFLGAYERTFGSYRQPNALQIYAARLNKDPSFHPALVSLGAHAFSVINRTYSQERYDPRKNPHLQRLHEYNPDLLRAWQENSKGPLQIPKISPASHAAAQVAPPVPLEGYFIHETDDAEDMLLCGTEILGSCTKVDGDPISTEGLVGYLRNGQTRLIAIKDKGGRLVARCLLRLLWDDEAKRPVLLLERLYSNAASDVRTYQYHKAIIAKAKQTAMRLNCTLTGLELPLNEYDEAGLELPQNKYANYPHPLKSLGGAAPCEYVDAKGGVEKGPYEIGGAKIVYEP